MFTLIRCYWPEYRRYRNKLLLALLAMVMVAGASGATAWMMKPLLDEILINKNTTMLTALPFFIMLAFLIKGVGTYVQQYTMSFVGQDIVRQVRDRLLRHLLHLDLDFFHRNHSGELISRVTNDIGRIQSAVSSDLATLVREAMSAVVLIGVVIYQSPSLAFITLVVIPAAYFPVELITRRLRKISHTTQARSATLSANLSEMFSNIEAIKAYHTESFEADHFARTNHSVFESSMKSVRIGGLVVPVMELFSSISGAIVIGLGGKAVIDGDLSAGAFFAFMTALFMAVDPIRRLTQTYAQFQDAIAAHERIQGMLTLTPEVRNGDVELRDVTSLSLHQTSLTYGGKTALCEVDLDAHKGEVIALVGGSGGGKSSVASLLLRFYDASAGEVVLNGQDIRTYSFTSVRAQIAIVTQRVHIFNDSIAANVAYGADVDEARVMDALKKANLWEHVASLPAGIHTHLNEAGTNLSGGQRQRIAIARALFRAPSVLILDEATSALDNQSEAAILETIRALAPEVITIIIAHRLKSVEIADRIYLIQNGQVVCHGKQAELMHDCTQFQELYQ